MKSKKSLDDLCKEIKDSTIFQMIDHLYASHQFSIKMMCNLFQVSRSSYYAFKSHQPSQRNQENKLLKKRIMISYLASSKRYGTPKIHKDLLEKGQQISEKRVQKLMTELNIRSIVRKKYRPVSLSNQEAKEYPNLLKRDFSTDKINQKWVTDVTYIYTLSDGWCYSSILDLHSRIIIAWRLYRQMETRLVLETLQDALNK